MIHGLNLLSDQFARTVEDNDEIALRNLPREHPIDFSVTLRCQDFVPNHDIFDRNVATTKANQFPNSQAKFLAVEIIIVLAFLDRPNQKLFAGWPSPLVVGFGRVPLATIAKHREQAIATGHDVVQVLVLAVEDDSLAECSVSSYQSSETHQLVFRFSGGPRAVRQKLVCRARRDQCLRPWERLPNDVGFIHGGHFPEVLVEWSRPRLPIRRRRPPEEPPSRRRRR